MEEVDIISASFSHTSANKLHVFVCLVKETLFRILFVLNFF